MVNPNKRVKRPDGLGKVYRYRKIENENTEGEDIIQTLPIEKTLDDNYVYLARAIKKEDYYITPNDSCFFFKEILYDNEVVGFATYRPSNIDDHSLVMQYYYVLPEFRQKGLLEEELDEATTLFESSILLEYPTHDMIESLIKHKLARVFEDRFVISRIPFYTPIVPVSAAVDGTMRGEYVFKDNTIYHKLSLIYDLHLCAVVGLASDDITKDYTEDVVADEDENMNDYNVMSLPLGIDNEKYGCVEKRKNDIDIIENTYFSKVRKLLDDNDNLIENWLTIL